MADIKPSDVRYPNGQITRNGVRYGCHCDMFAMPDDAEPDGCVIDEGNHSHCVYAFINGRKRRSRWTCKEWKPVQGAKP